MPFNSILPHPNIHLSTIFSHQGLFIFVTIVCLECTMAKRYNRKRVCFCVSESMFVCEREWVCACVRVCVCLRERERESYWMRKSRSRSSSKVIPFWKVKRKELTSFQYLFSKSRFWPSVSLFDASNDWCWVDHNHSTSSNNNNKGNNNNSNSNNNSNLSKNFCQNFFAEICFLKICSNYRQT